MEASTEPAREGTQGTAEGCVVVPEQRYGTTAFGQVCILLLLKSIRCLVSFTLNNVSL